MNRALAGAWMLVLCAIPFSMALASGGDWPLLLICVLLPPLLLVRLRRQQEQTISESIREAIR